MYSVDFAEIEALQHTEEWELLGEELRRVSISLEKAGADCLILCTNTMHKLADVIEKSVAIPLLHIADATAASIKENGLRRVGLLGTKFTMEQDFYKARLQDKHGIEVVIPQQHHRNLVHKVIYEELVSGVIRNESRERFREIISALKDDGAEGVILGCTEIPLLIQSEHSPIPVFDTTTLHAQMAVDWVLKEE